MSHTDCRAIFLNRFVDEMLKSKNAESVTEKNELLQSFLGSLNRRTIRHLSWHECRR